jgi:prepilin-type N-terminal cleavage/methylation domain-containing protein
MLAKAVRRRMRLSSCPQARRKTPGLSGLTLVEVLVAVTILSVALLAYLTLVLASRTTVDRGEFFTLAAQVAGNKLAECRALGYSGLTDGTTVYSISGLREGRMTVFIGPMDGIAGNTNIRQVDITVTWAAASDRTPQTAGRVQYSTLLCNRL